MKLSQLGVPGSCPLARVARARGRPSGAPAAARALEPVRPAEPGSPEARRRSAWARIVKKVLEVDPLLCPRCRTEMQVIAWITDRAVIDRILEHRKIAGLESPFDAFDARGPPLPG